jgi:1-acyl-sn-glycerol-3-phosphate acyltransferase
LVIGAITRARSLLGIVIGVLFTASCSCVVMLAGVARQTETATRMMRWWARASLWLFGIDVNVRGEERLPNAGGAIVVFNHQSHFDIPVIMAATAKNIRFGAKVELFRIPFFGHAMRAVGTLPTARDNREEVMKIYELAEQRFAENVIFVLAPEGTRQTEPHIGRFKKGPFIFAAKARVPVVPAVLTGAIEVLPKHSLHVNVGAWKRTVAIEFMPPVAISRSVAENSEQMSIQIESIHDQMSSVYVKKRSTM